MGVASQVKASVPRVSVGLSSDSEFFLLRFFFNLCGDGGETGETGKTGVCTTGERLLSRSAAWASVDVEDARAIDEGVGNPRCEFCLSIRVYIEGKRGDKSSMDSVPAKESGTNPPAVCKRLRVQIRRSLNLTWNIPQRVEQMLVNKGSWWRSRLLCARTGKQPQKSDSYYRSHVDS